MRRAVDAANVLLRVSVALVAVSAALPWAAPGSRDGRPFLPARGSNTRARREQAARSGAKDARA